MAFASKLISIVAAGILVLAWIFYVVANAVPQWNKIGEGEIHSTTGLWKSCVIVSGHTECRDYTCSSGTSSCGKILAAPGKFFAWVCLIAGIIGVAIGVDTLTRYESERVPWGASSIIGVIALVVNAVGAAVSLAAN